LKSRPYGRLFRICSLPTEQRDMRSWVVEGGQMAPS